MPHPSTPELDTTHRLPYDLQVASDEALQSHYAVVDRQGRIWAQAVPTHQSAKLVALVPKLLGGLYEAYCELGNELHWGRWDIGSNGPDINELAEDDGELEERYPGAPEFARWLLALREVLDEAGALGRDWPIDMDEPVQLELL